MADKCLDATAWADNTWDWDAWAYVAAALLYAELGDTALSRSFLDTISGRSFLDTALNR